MAWDVVLRNLLVLMYFVIIVVIAEEEELKIPLRSGYLEGNIYFELLEPKEIRYTFRIRPAKNFGGVLNTTFYGVQLVPVFPVHGCSDIENIDIIPGAIALIERGQCSFVSKTLKAEQAGALGAIIMDYDLENDQRMIDMIGDDTGRIPKIPAFFLLGKDGHMIRQTLEHLKLDSASINIPINMTGMQTHKINHPPWSIW